MTREQLLELKSKLSKLSEEEQKLRDLYLRQLSNGELQGPPVGYPSIDKPWLKYYSPKQVKTVFPEMNMRQYLEKCCEYNLDKTALNYYGNKVSYEKLLYKIEEAKKAFNFIGVKSGDVVSIAAPFLPETIYSVYAINALGAVANLIDPRVPSEKFLNYLTNSNSKFLIAYDACAKKIEEIEEKANLEEIVLISATDSLPIGLKIASKIKNGLKKKEDVPFLNWQDFIAGANYEEPVLDAEYIKDSPAIVVYTSGTSGEPKGAISSNESFNNIACSQAYSLKETKVGDKFLLIMPPFIAYGIAIGMHGQLCRGQELIMVPSFTIDNQKELLGNLVFKHKPQTIMGVPSFMADLIKHPKMQKLDCSFLKTIIVGGDSMIPSSEVQVDNFMREHNSTARICKGWGLTEVNSAFSYTKDVENNEIGSVGIPLMGNNIMIVNPSQEEAIDFDKLEEVGYNAKGELFIKSPSVILDYLNNEEESEKVFFNSRITDERWVRTKDLGRITENGVIYIEGRMKRIIIRPDGHNISPFAIENIINADNRVNSCAVVGKPSGIDEHGSFAVAYIELKKEYLSNSIEILAEIKHIVELQLPPRDVASEYKLIEEIPLTSIGKVDYKNLEENEMKLLLKK